MANFDRNVGSLTPVGIYPSGAGRYGHSDLSGNVWEWCSDIDEIEGIEEPVRVLRGGDWGDPAEDLRAACRSRSPASYRWDYVGFRVLASPASPSKA